MQESKRHRQHEGRETSHDAASQLSIKLTVTFMAIAQSVRDATASLSVRNQSVICECQCMRERDARESAR